MYLNQKLKMQDESIDFKFQKIGLNQDEELQDNAEKQIFGFGIPLNLLQSSKIQIQLLLCFLCKKILWKPATCNQSNCFANFCSACLVKYQQNSKKTNQFTIQQLIQCPKCSKMIQKTQLPLIKNILSDMKLKCFFHKQGCSDIIKYDLLQKHHQNCLYKKINCKGCFNLFKRKDFETHILQCEQILIECDRCMIKLQRKQMNQHQLWKCLEHQLMNKNIHLAKIQNKVSKLQQKISQYQRIIQKLVKGQPFNLQIQFHTSFPNNLKIASQSKQITLQKDSFNVIKQKYDFLHFYITTPINTYSPINLQWKMNIKILKGNLLIGICSSLNSNSIDFVINKYGQIKKKQLNQSKYKLVRKSNITFQQNDKVGFYFIPIKKILLIKNINKSIQTTLNYDQISCLGPQFFSFYSLDTINDKIQFQ